ncbi:MAG TPA: hypothetical protein VKI19_02930, partial [Acidimicrobiales bacterium]|nr:hypothetical protein [Acidimicrobiales bacterium]
FLMIPLLWLMLALTAVTAVQRFVTVWRQANAAGQRPPPAERKVFVRRAGYETAPMSVRWRAWREANGWAPRPTRYGERARPGSASARWQERRRARLARLRGERPAGEDLAPPTALRRRGGTRRP